MPRRDRFAYNRTLPYGSFVLAGYDFSESYRKLSNFIIRARYYLSSIYFLSWAPEWLCVIVLVLWPLNHQNCSCCLREARRYNRHGPSLTEVQKAARLGCMRCEIITAGILAIAQEGNLKLQGQEFLDLIEGVYFVRGERSIEIDWRKEKNQVIAKRLAIKFYIAPASCKILPDLLVEGGVTGSSDSDYCFDLIKIWLQKCIDSHISCQTLPESPAFVPSRLICVRNLRLILGQDVFKSDNTRYIALSHCWGLQTECKGPIPSTTTLNLEEHLKSIKWADLTLSFQHAIIAARRLDVDYLWIDSICILQDSEDDWARESALMGKIYSGAYLVISATKSRNGDVGIFHERSKSIGFSSPVLKDQHILLREQLTHQNFFVVHKPNFDNDPVFSRGWCYQERLLARRIVHYTDNELIWECCQELECECGGIKREADNLTEGHPTRKEFKAKFSTLLSSEDQEERDQCWMHIIEGYSARSLSFEADRLPALSGIAQQVSQAEKGRYLAGMWETDLPNSLLWYPPYMERKFRDNVTRVPGVPSWAWPATGMGVTPHYERGWYLETVADVEEVTCATSTTDSFGRVSGGHITLRAPIVAVIFHEETSGHMTLVNVDDPEDSCQLFPDSYSRSYLPLVNEVVYCVGIEIDLRPSHISGFKCVVVRASMKSNEFLRISQTNCPKRWAEKAEKRLITIV